MTETEKGLLITSPLSYLFHKPLLWSVNISSGTTATTEQVILPHPLPSPSCPQFKTSQCPNRIDPNSNPTLQPFLSSEESHCLLPNVHWRLSMKKEMLDRRQRSVGRDQIQAYLQLTMFFCVEATLNLLLNNWLSPPCSKSPWEAFVVCSKDVSAACTANLPFRKGTSPSGHSLQYKMFCFFSSYPLPFYFYLPVITFN